LALLVGLAYHPDENPEDVSNPLPDRFHVESAALEIAVTRDADTKDKTSLPGACVRILNGLRRFAS